MRMPQKFQEHPLHTLGDIALCRLNLDIANLHLMSSGIDNDMFNESNRDEKV